MKNEYMLFKSTCPICEKTIRDGKITRCTIADSAIEKILDTRLNIYENSRTSSKKNYDQWITKKFRNDLYYQSKKIYPQDINSHTISQSKINVDVRDSEYVWCEARIVAIIEAKDQENSILVHFKGWDLKYDEIIPVSSPRLARLGFYTNRKDIPYYMETPNKIKKPIIGIHEGNYKIIDELKRQILEGHNITIFTLIALLIQIYNEEFKKNKKNLLDSDEDAPNNIDEHYEYLKEKCMSVIHHYARRNTGTPNSSFNANDLRLRSGASYVYLTSGLNSNNFRIRIPTFDSRRMIQNWNR